MGLFDNVIAEETSTTTATTSSQTNLASDDGGFLILGDAPTQSYSAPEIKAEDIPDSAISFLDLSALSSQPAPSLIQESSNEEVTMLSETKSNDEFSLFLDSVEVPAPVAELNIDSEFKEVDTAEEGITMLENTSVEEEVLPTVEAISYELNIQEPIVEEKPQESTSMFSEIVEAVEAVIKDPLAILDKAIDELQELLLGHAAVRNEKMANVDKINDQISTLKQEAKKLTEESKNISLEEEKVNKMINTFKAQKV